jgi:hypothetical protein
MRVSSRVGLAVVGAAAAAAALAGAAPSKPPVGTAIYTVQADPRLCPSPLCGGYWVAVTNVARTRCHDGAQRSGCYVAGLVEGKRHPLATPVPDGSLARASLEASEYGDLGRLGVLAVDAVYAPAGTASVSGGRYRVRDTGVRCVRAPCFSYRATPINGSTRIRVSSVALSASGATPGDVARAELALQTRNGLFARGRFARTERGGLVFRALRLYLRAR